jgi:hypothetical protein
MINKMYMKQLILLILILFTAQNLSASPRSTINSSDFSLEKARVNIRALESENRKLKNEVATLRRTLSTQKVAIDSLGQNLMVTRGEIAALSDSLNINMANARSEIQASSDGLNQTINSKSKIGLWICVAIVLVLIGLAFIFGRLIAKRGTEVASLTAKADKLNEEIVNRLSNELIEMHSITKQISSVVTASENESSDGERKLIQTLVDRITFMEMTLYKMDSSVRGYKQLKKSIAQMKDNLQSNGYEVVDMLGKDYHEGMKVTASFVEDEELPEGKQIITGIIKPQINYKGEMIQSAQIIVSQNI